MVPEYQGGAGGNVPGLIMVSNAESAGSWPSSVAELLRRLIALPSVNPDGDPGTDRTGEGECAEYVGALLAEIGADVHYDEILPGRPNVIGRFPATTPGKPRVLLAPHTDTVGVGSMTVDPFGGEIRDGKIFGRGACDTKGTMAAMLWALRELGAERLATLDIEVSFVGLMGEESGQPGSRDFATRYRGHYAFALVGEPTGCQIVNKHKGTLWVILSTRGKAVHGSTPELGVNAIAKMARVITALDTTFRERLAAPEFADPILGSPTINPGICRGGTRSNIVPEHCTLSLDLRVTPALATRGALAFLTEFLEEIGFDGEIRPTLQCHPLDVSADHPFVRRLRALPQAPVCVGAPWFCDAAVLAEGAIPSVAAGPGSITQAHTADEWIAIEALEEGVAFYRDFLTGDSGRR
jgi:succinyl-diaminopimelate desuccinylase